VSTSGLDLSGANRRIGPEWENERLGIFEKLKNVELVLSRKWIYLELHVSAQFY
jgi:hypothetical protein